MTAWPPEQLQRFATLDNFHVAPYRPDGVATGTPTWIWSVVVDGALYIRPYYGQRSRWYQAAMTQGAGRTQLGGDEYDVRYVPAPAEVRDAVDDAYRAKYGSSRYLSPMIADGPREATVRVEPAA